MLSFFVLCTSVRGPRRTNCCTHSGRAGPVAVADSPAWPGRPDARSSSPDSVAAGRRSASPVSRCYSRARDSSRCPIAAASGTAAPPWRGRRQGLASGRTDLTSRRIVTSGWANGPLSPLCDTWVKREQFK